MTGRVDRASMVDHLATLETTVAILRGFAARPTAEWADEANLWSLAHGMQLAIQNVLDVATHLVAALQAGGAPEDYREAILKLGGLGVVDTPFAARIAPMAGLRNILVHGYLRLEAARLVEALQHLDDFAVFAAAIHAFLAANPGI